MFEPASIKAHKWLMSCFVLTRIRRWLCLAKQISSNYIGSFRFRMKDNAAACRMYLIIKWVKVIALYTYDIRKYKAMVKVV